MGKVAFHGKGRRRKLLQLKGLNLSQLVETGVKGGRKRDRVPLGGGSSYGLYLNGEGKRGSRRI